MHASVPQDVDLEDRLIYGLTPLRFGYLVIAALASLSLGRFEILPPWFRVLPCLLLVGVGAALAWGRWHGRALDRWLLDLGVFLCRNYHLRLRFRSRGTQPEVSVPLGAIKSISITHRGPTA